MFRSQAAARAQTHTQTHTPCNTHLVHAGHHASERKEKRGLHLLTLNKENPKNEILWACLLKGPCIRNCLTTLPVRVPVLSKQTIDVAAAVPSAEGKTRSMPCAFSLPLLKPPPNSMAAGAPGGVARATQSSILRAMLLADWLNCTALTTYGIYISSCTTREKVYNLKIF